MIKVVSQVKGLNLFKILQDTGSIMEGHFELSSGYHSNYYLQCARLLQYPDITFKIAGKALDLIGEKIDIKKIDAIVSPAIGGVLWGYMLAYIAGCRMIFTERRNENMELRRGFEIKENEKIIVAEDVITTGGSVKEVIEICSRYGGLIKLDIDKYLPSSCRLCKENHPLNYPGSKKKCK